MITTTYKYPLPNNGAGYSFSEQELVKLLDSVYKKGFEDGILSTKEPETTTASAVTDMRIVYNRNYRPYQGSREPLLIVEEDK